jgi:hypothetical protein
VNNPELVASLLKKGGKVLIAGGETKDLPRAYQEHAQILIWDDNKQNINMREIPANVKIIIYTRWVSHATARRLSEAAVKLHAIKFPMLRPREVKSLLSEVIPVSPPTFEEIKQEHDAEIAQTTTPEIEEPVVKTKRNISPAGSIQSLLAEHLNREIDFTIWGSARKEAERILPIAKERGLTNATLNSIGGAIPYFLKRNKDKPTPKIQPVVKVESSSDDFAELDRLIGDAILALKLVQEHMPKVRNETEKLRGMKEQFRKLLE